MSNGQDANETTFNNAFMSRTQNTDTIGEVSLDNTSNINSGVKITNLQQLVNEIRTSSGVTEGALDNNDYSSNNVVTNGDSRKVAIGKFDAQFDNTTGHDHDGVNSTLIDALNLSNIEQLKRNLLIFANDGDFVTAIGAASDGDIYFNDTDDRVRVYASGSFSDLAGTMAAQREAPTGLVNGSNTVFTLSLVPISENHLSVYIDGVFQDNSDYSVLTNTITFNTAPTSGSTIFVWYFHDGVVTPITPPAGTRNVEYITLTLTDETNEFVTLTNTPATASLTILDLIGGTSQQFGVDYTVTGDQLSWSGLGLDGVLVENDTIRVIYDS